MERPTAGLASQGKPPKQVPRIGDLVIYFLRLGTFGFGGPVALCGLMEKELVQDSAGLPGRRCEMPSPSPNPYPDLSPSRSASLLPIFAVASGEHGQEAGLLFCPTF
jgi:hypothetical protein